jgi:hypothetical protein
VKCMYKFGAQKLTKRQTRLLLSFRSKLNWISVQCTYYSHSCACVSPVNRFFVNPVFCHFSNSTDPERVRTYVEGNLKTDQKANSITIVLQKQTELDICPVYLLQSFLRVRFSGIKGSDKLYVHFDGSALTRYQF